MRVKVQVDKRNDGLITVTVKLIAWDLNRLRALVSGIALHPMGRQVGQKMGEALKE